MSILGAHVHIMYICEVHLNSISRCTTTIFSFGADRGVEEPLKLSELMCHVAHVYCYQGTSRNERQVGVRETHDALYWKLTRLRSP